MSHLGLYEYKVQSLNVKILLFDSLIYSDSLCHSQKMGLGMPVSDIKDLIICECLHRHA